jgi:molybdopterin molybdotransferase/putative molybdopterin biosynthesis protein
MDGIAVRAADLAEATPMAPARLDAEAFSAVDTGDPLPPAHDAVVMREDVTYLPDGSVELIAPVRPLRHVRTVGEDVMAGELLLPGGHELRPVDVAVAAGAGHLTLPVRRRPRIAVLPTGDEVRPLGTEIGRGEILDTNSVMLSAMIREAGGTPVGLPITRDDRDALAAAIRAAAAQADLVLVVAGSSAGRDDHTATVLSDLGEVAVHGVAMRPGHPVVLGLVRAHTPVPAIGVPGYPVSAVHVFDTFARPFLRLLHGSGSRERTAVRATLTRTVTSRAGADECIAVRLDTGPVGGAVLAEPIRRGAGALSVLMRADGLLRVPAESTRLDAGMEVLVEPIPGAPGRPMDDDDAAASAPLIIPRHPTPSSARVR